MSRALPPDNTGRSDAATPVCDQARSDAVPTSTVQLTDENMARIQQDHKAEVVLKEQRLRALVAAADELGFNMSDGTLDVTGLKPMENWVRQKKSDPWTVGKDRAV
jgi:hypothetical protein